jgi:hypothetical protein
VVFASWSVSCGWEWLFSRHSNRSIRVRQRRSDASGELDDQLGSSGKAKPLDASPFCIPELEWPFRFSTIAS